MIVDSGEESVIIDFEGIQVVIVDPESLIADRLAAWQVWESPEDGVNAWLLTRQRRPDLSRIKGLSEAKGVPEAAERLSEVVERWREQDPTREELVEWAENLPSK